MAHLKLRKTNKTLLLVGEGSDEQAFLNHLKMHLIGKASGLTISIKNAKGKGAKHVIDFTVRQMKIAKFDKVAVLFDTDTDWDLSLEKKQKPKKLLY